MAAQVIVQILAQVDQVAVDRLGRLQRDIPGLELGLGRMFLAVAMVIPGVAWVRQAAVAAQELSVVMDQHKEAEQQGHLAMVEQVSRGVLIQPPMLAVVVVLAIIALLLLPLELGLMAAVTDLRHVGLETLAAMELPTLAVAAVAALAAEVTAAALAVQVL